MSENHTPGKLSALIGHAPILIMCGEDEIPMAEVGSCEGSTPVDYANAARIVQTWNAHEDLLEVVQCFFTWHANHFGDFGHDIDSELLCLANDAEAAIAKAEGSD